MSVARVPLLVLTSICPRCTKAAKTTVTAVKLLPARRIKSNEITPALPPADEGTRPATTPTLPRTPDLTGPVLFAAAVAAVAATAFADNDDDAVEVFVAALS